MDKFPPGIVSALADADFQARSELKPRLVEVLSAAETSNELASILADYVELVARPLLNLLHASGWGPESFSTPSLFIKGPLRDLDFVFWARWDQFVLDTWSGLGHLSKCPHLLKSTPLVKRNSLTTSALHRLEDVLAQVRRAATPAQKWAACPQLDKDAEAVLFETEAEARTWLQSKESQDWLEDPLLVISLRDCCGPPFLGKTFMNWRAQVAPPPDGPTTTDRMVEEAKREFRGQTPWPVYYLDSDWEFDALEGDVELLQGHDHAGQVFSSARESVRQAIGDFDTAIRKRHGPLSAPAVGYFYQSYQLHRHITLFSKEFSRTETARSHHYSSSDCDDAKWTLRRWANTYGRQAAQTLEELEQLLDISKRSKLSSKLAFPDKKSNLLERQLRHQRKKRISQYQEAIEQKREDARDSQLSSPGTAKGEIQQELPPDALTLQINPFPYKGVAGEAMPTDFWESLRLGFMQLRADCAINPPIAMAGRLTAIWTAQPQPGSWRLNYHNGEDGAGVTQRFKWHAQGAAARIGFTGDGDAAVSFWLDRVRSEAPESHLSRIMSSNEPESPDELYRVEILDICGLSAEYCRSCEASENRLRASQDARTERHAGLYEATVVDESTDPNNLVEEGWIRVPRADWRDDANLSLETPALLLPAQAQRLAAIATLWEEATATIQSAMPQTTDEVKQCLWPAISKYARQLFDGMAETRLSVLGQDSVSNEFGIWLRSKCLPAVALDICGPIIGQLFISARNAAESLGESTVPKINETRRALWGILKEVIGGPLPPMFATVSRRTFKRGVFSGKLAARAHCKQQSTRPTMKG